MKEESNKHSDDHSNSNDQQLTLTIQTTKGVWENAVFSKTAKVSEILQQVITKFGFAADGNYKLKIKGAPENLEPQRTLVSYHLKDGDVLSFTDLGKGA
jgi:hypothetical protein